MGRNSCVRIPKPSFREERGSWFVTFSGKRRNLGPKKAEAMELLLAPVRRQLDFQRRWKAPKCPNGADPAPRENRMMAVSTSLPSGVAAGADDKRSRNARQA